MDRRKVEANIGKYYWAVSLAYFGFFTPIIQLFYLDHNLTVFKIAILGVVWTVTKMISEVPSSVLADKWGRKKVMLMSSTFAILQLVILILGTGYGAFVAASICSAISFAFLSGTDVAFFYDSLKELGKEEEFDKLWARQQIYQQIPLFISFLSSGFLYKISPLLPFQLSLGFLIMSWLVLWTLTEPKFYKPVEEVNIFDHLKQSGQYIWQSKPLRFMLGFVLIFSLGSDISYGYGQVYLKQLSFPVALVGIVYTVKSIFCTVAANMTPILRKKLSDDKVLGLQMGLLAGLFWIMAMTNNYWVGAASFAMIAIPYGLYEISKSAYIHKHIESHQRATIDSMFSFIVALVFLVLEPIFGWAVDSFSIKLPYLFIAVTISLYSGFYYLAKSKEV